MSQDFSIADLDVAFAKANDSVILLQLENFIDPIKQIVYNDVIGSAIQAIEDNNSTRKILYQFVEILNDDILRSMYRKSSNTGEGTDDTSGPSRMAFTALQGIIDLLPEKPTGGDTFGPFVSNFRIQFQVATLKDAYSLVIQNPGHRLSAQIGPKPALGKADLPPPGTF